MGGCCQKESVTPGPLGKASVCCRSAVVGQDLLAHSGGGHSGELEALLRSELKREAPGLHNELMERFPQLSRGCGDRAGGSYPCAVLDHSRN